MIIKRDRDRSSVYLLGKFYINIQVWLLEQNFFNLCIRYTNSVTNAMCRNFEDSSAATGRRFTWNTCPFRDPARTRFESVLITESPPKF